MEVNLYLMSTHYKSETAGNFAYIISFNTVRFFLSTFCDRTKTQSGQDRISCSKLMDVWPGI